MLQCYGRASSVGGRGGRCSHGTPASTYGVAPVASVHRMRQCSRPACAEPAEATLTYHYASGTAWIDGLSGEREPHRYDLCSGHAARVRVPHGWTLVDRRSPVAA